jgi:cysteine desulfurase
LSLGNPSSRHTLGQAQAEAIEAAREQVRAAVSSSSSDAIVFTSGATEANALAIRALALAGRERGLVDRRHVLISATEHPSAMLSATALRRDGFDVEIASPSAPADLDGRLGGAGMISRLRADTVLVVQMLVNQVTGAVYSVAELAEAAKVVAPHARLFVDCTQAFGKIPVRYRIRHSGSQHDLTCIFL